MKKVKGIALLAAILSAILVFIFLNSLNNQHQIKKSGVLVASENIPAGTPITNAMIKISKLPEEAILADAIIDDSLVLGKVTKYEIRAGEQILSAKLATAGDTEGSSLSYVLKPGMRAITIAVNAVSGVGYMIEPGNHVDIVAQYNQQDTAFTKVIVQDVAVLAIDASLTNKKDLTGKDASYSTITLQVTPEQVMDLSFYEYTGQLCAVLRSPLDKKIIDLPVKQ